MPPNNKTVSSGQGDIRMECDEHILDVDLETVEVKDIHIQGKQGVIKWSWLC